MSYEAQPFRRNVLTREERFCNGDATVAQTKAERAMKAAAKRAIMKCVRLRCGFKVETVKVRWGTTMDKMGDWCRVDS